MFQQTMEISVLFCCVHLELFHCQYNFYFKCKSYVIYNSVKFKTLKKYLTEINTYFNKINKVPMLSQEDFCNSVLTNLQEIITTLQNTITAKDAIITTKDIEIAAKNAEITALQNDITAKDAIITTKDIEIAAKNTKITALQNDITAIITTKDIEIAAKKNDITTKDAIIAKLESIVNSTYVIQY